MARRGYRRATTSPAGSGANRPSPGGGGGRRRPPGEPTEQDIARSIRQSAARVRVALQLGAEEGETSTLSDVVREFEATLDARRSAAVTEASHVRVELLECGLNNWQNLVELQRVVAGLQRPKGEEGEEQLLTGKTTLRHDPKYDEWTLALSFSRASEDSLWTFANALMLRLRSAGVFSRVLLPQRVLLPLMSACVEWDSDQLHFQWEGKSVWSQVVVYGVSEGRMNESQRVVMPSISGVPSSVSDPLPKLRNPDLVPLVDDMLSASSTRELSSLGCRSPFVVSRSYKMDLAKHYASS
ncbi:NEDD4-binding protein 2 [Phytophthora boehmeriae]|uniref:NEDD4-binding protein 2 n=1 Tax=Phytophthora boehmeriae TaxID=109152 RepID=A0A8T1WWX6_9STRA|nr:NEDD4-binding protein 2 [Phytophthora boehmeriae]